jgi:AcrR family transcriptional regulator
VSRRDEILEVAAELFFERGFHGVGVDEIGERAGMSGPALYRHFRSKDELLAALFDRAMDLVSADLPPEDGEDSDATLDQLIRRHARFVVEHRHLVSIYAHEHRSLVDPWRKPFLRRLRAHARRWELAIAAACPDAADDDVSLAAQGSIGLLHSVIYWPPGVLKADDVIDRLCALVRGGIGGLATLTAPP